MKQNFWTQLSPEPTVWTPVLEQLVTRLLSRTLLSMYKVSAKKKEENVSRWELDHFLCPNGCFRDLRKRRYKHNIGNCPGRPRSPDKPDREGFQHTAESKEMNKQTGLLGKEAS